MKTLFRVLAPLLLVMFGFHAGADVLLDETFEGKGAFKDLRSAATDISAKGINVQSASGSSKSLLAYDSMSPLTQGRLFTFSPLDTESGSDELPPAPIPGGERKAHCWVLDAGEQIFWGQAGDANIPSGLGTINCDGGDLIVSQVFLAIPLWVAQKPSGTLVGSVAFCIGKPGSFHSLKYNLVCRGNGTVRIREIRDGVLARPIGEVFGGVWSPLTTVLASSSRKTWEASGSEKGWLTGTQITSPALACIYTFAGVNPIGEQGIPAPFADDPWVLQDSGPEGIGIRTIRYAAGPETPLLIDNLFLETGHRGQQMTADRMHPFNEVCAGLSPEIESLGANTPDASTRSKVSKD